MLIVGDRAAPADYHASVEQRRLERQLTRANATAVLNIGVGRMSRNLTLRPALAIRRGIGPGSLGALPAETAS